MNWLYVAQQTSIGPIQAVTLTEPTGPHLLFLHGVTRNHRDWSLILSALAPRFTPWAIDFRGHGQSARSREQYRVLHYIDDAVHIARQLIDRPLVLVGHSLGAMVALATAHRLRDQVQGVIIEDPPFETMGSRITSTMFHSQFVQFREILLAERWGSVSELARQLADVRLQDPTTGQSIRLGDARDEASIRFHASSLAKMDPEALTPIVEGDWLRGFKWIESAQNLDVPVLLLQADPNRGGMLTDADAASLRQQIRDLTVVRFPGVGHQIHTLAREDYLSAIGGFLESLGLDEGPMSNE